MLTRWPMSIIPQRVRDPRERAQAIGCVRRRCFGISMAWGRCWAVSSSTRSRGGRILLVNIPVGVLAIALTTMFVPESRAPHPRRIDPVGQLLVIAGLGTPQPTRSSRVGGSASVSPDPHS